MIKREELVEIGSLNKPHGISGEINASIDSGIKLSELRCIILDIDGIFVPFFVEASRLKGVDSYLLTIDGIEDEDAATVISKKTIYALKDDCTNTDAQEDNDAMYAEDFVGYTVVDDQNAPIGKIIDIDDSTENFLFIVEKTDGNTAYIPVADEFIIEINIEQAIIAMSLPEGLFDLNN